MSRLNVSFLRIVCNSRFHVFAGTAVVTLFTIACTGWTDEDNGPEEDLKYAYQYELNGEVTVIPSSKTYLGQGNEENKYNMTITVFISDGFGTKTRWDNDIRVRCIIGASI